MAVFTYTGYEITYGGDDTPTSIAPAVLQVTAPSADSTFSYAIEETTPGDLPMVAVDGEFTSAFVNGFIDVGNLDAYIGRIVWSGGTSQVLVLETGATDYAFQLGGVPLPAFDNLAGFLDFYDSITTVGQIGAQNTFAPGNDIRFDAIASLVNVDTGPGGPDEPDGASAFDAADPDGSAAEAIGQFLDGVPGVSLSNVSYTGAAGAAFLVDSFEIGGAEGYDFTGGFLLSSGGFPGPVNTSSSFTFEHETPGDDDLTRTAQEAFDFAGETEDAAVIEFTVNVTDENIDGMRFSLIFGSEEYPEWSDSSYVDVAGIYVNGVNVALFNNDPTTPLSVTQRNIDAGNFLNNNNGNGPHGDPGGFGDWDGANAPFGIEWDGFSNFLSIRAPLTQGNNHIKIGVADTGDTAYDSGIYVNDISLLSDGGAVGGVLNTVQASGETEASLLAEEFIVGTAPTTISGTAESFNNDVIVGFKPLIDQVVFLNSVVTIITVNLGSAVVKLDSTGDEEADTTITFAGSYTEADLDNFEIDVDGGNSVLTYTGEAGPSVIDGTPGDDTLEGTPEGDLIRGFAGNDVLRGFEGDDTLNGGGGDDTLFGGAGDDVLNGGPGDDVLRGGQGHDTLRGGPGDDTLHGGAGHDVLRGGGGDDELRGGLGADSLYGGAGHDVLYGGAGHDFLHGGAGHDTLFGGAGNDSLFGGAGHDVLRGGQGADTLDGGRGDDTLYGGAGADVFIFRAGGGHDVVMDFDAAEGDLLHIGAGAWNNLQSVQNQSGDLVFLFGAGGDNSLTLAGHGGTPQSVYEDWIEVI